jgi:Rhs element Vgr protein
MTGQRTIPSAEPKSVATSTIISAGKAVSKEYQILSIAVNKEINHIAAATIIILDGEAAKETFEISNKPEFEPGKEIEIKMGYRSNEETVFKGIVVRHGIKVRQKTSVLVIECRDKAVKMTVTCKSKYFKEVKDSEAMEEIIGKYGLDKDVKPTAISHKELVQYNSTDWDFILCRADVNGLLCITDNGKINIAKPQFSGNAVLTIQHGATIHDLDAEIDARLQYKSVKGSSWRHTDQELLDSVEAKEPSIPAAGNITAASLADVIGEKEFRLFHSGQMEEPELQAWADAKLMKNRLAKIRGRVSTDGTAAVNPGQLIQLNGIGERFQGKLFVTGVHHQFEKGEWETVFQFGLNPEWFAQEYNVQEPLAGALLPAIQGLQAGIVTQLEKDPDGEDRIMVRIPVIHKDDEGVWCRVCTLDAGKNRGTFFRPEIDDEVIIGFINDDPRHGIVLGMLNSSVKPAPLQASDDNHEKGYVSRSEMKMIFNDDKKSINIETPGGNKIIITEESKKIHIEDQNGNKLIMDKDGIKIESVKDISIKAPGKIEQKGATIEVVGDSSVKVNANGEAELSAGGKTTVKGSQVEIN